MTVRRRLLVSGRVQGVFYRDTCRRVARDEGVAGAARNLPDGRVEVVLEGDPDPVGRVERWCAEGPDGAVVEGVEAHDETPRGMRGFDVV